MYDPTRYACAFPAMMRDWRGLFSLPDLPFYFVLLAGQNGAHSPHFTSPPTASLPECLLMAWPEQ